MGESFLSLEVNFKKAVFKPFNDIKTVMFKIAIVIKKIPLPSAPT